LRTLSYLKSRIVPSNRRPLEILRGPFRGIRMNLTLQSQSQFFLGLFEKETHSWLRSLTRNVQTAVDAGAAYGEHTLYFLLRTQAKTVLAFEPDKDLHAAIHQNLDLNPPIATHRLELSGSFLGSTAAQNIESLDALLTRITFPCFIKVDVDGGEEEILRGATLLNRKSGVRWLIETHSLDLELACERRLKEAGFKTVIIPNAWWRKIIPEQRPGNHNRWLAAWNDSAVN